MESTIQLSSAISERLIARVSLYLSSSWVQFIFHPCMAISDVHRGYYNPLLAYGEDKAILDAAAAGANGFIMVDLPPEEAVGFREKCASAQFVILRLI